MKLMCELSGQRNAICDKPKRYPRPRLHLLHALAARRGWSSKRTWGSLSFFDEVRVSRSAWRALCHWPRVGSDRSPHRLQLSLLPLQLLRFVHSFIPRGFGFCRRRSGSGKREGTVGVSERTRQPQLRRWQSLPSEASLAGTRI
jgi:hypothetical protein